MFRWMGERVRVKHATTIHNVSITIKYGGLGFLLLCTSAYFVFIYRFMSEIHLIWACLVYVSFVTVFVPYFVVISPP